MRRNSKLRTGRCLELGNGLYGSKLPGHFSLGTLVALMLQVLAYNHSAPDVYMHPKKYMYKVKTVNILPCMVLINGCERILECCELYKNESLASSFLCLINYKLGCSVHKTFAVQSIRSSLQRRCV